MATYPLKNISIGGDTYEIQSGDKSYRVTLRAVFNNTSIPISSLSIKDILETYASSITWDIVGIYKIGPGGGSYDPAQTMLDDLIGMKYYQAQYEFRGSDTTKRGNFISWSPEDQQACQPMFGIVDYNNNPPTITGLVTVSVDTEQNLVSNMYLSNFGGGGGGSEVIRLSLRNQSNAAMAFAALSDNAVFKLYDGSIYWDVTRINAATMAGHTIAIVDNNNATTYLFYNDTAGSFFSFDYLSGGAWSPSRMCVVAEGSSNTFTVRSRKMVPLS